jgi:hypothetical protein
MIDAGLPPAVILDKACKYCSSNFFSELDQVGDDALYSQRFWSARVSFGSLLHNLLSS